MADCYYGFPSLYKPPSDIDFYVLSNEDIGFIATLDPAVNNVYSFSLPYPSSIDLFNETIVVHLLEFIFQYSQAAKHGLEMNGLSIFLSMLNKPFDALFSVTAVNDTRDEMLKACFAGMMFFGQKKCHLQVAANTQALIVEGDMVQNAIYVPPIPLDLVTPLYIQYVNQSVDINAGTLVTSAKTFPYFEDCFIRVWFTIRKLSIEEKSARAMQIRWQRLDA